MRVFSYSITHFIFISHITQNTIFRNTTNYSPVIIEGTIHSYSHMTGQHMNVIIKKQGYHSYGIY